MPNGLIPPGYQAVLIGSAMTVDELSTFAPMEEGAAEGSLMLMELDFAEPVSPETLGELNQACLDAGVLPWPGCEYVVYAETGSPTVYLAWQKAIAWLPIIIGILATVLLPPLIGSVIWMLIPEPVKELITGLIGMGMMMLVMWLMMSLIKPLTAPEKPKRVEEAKT
jgi:hypothetical protein